MNKFRQYLEKARNYSEDRVDMDIITKWNKPAGEQGREVTGNEVAFNVENPVKENVQFNSVLISFMKKQYETAVSLKEKMTVELFFLSLYKKLKEFLELQLKNKKITLTMEDDYREVITKFGNSANEKLKTYPFYKIGIGAKEIYVTWDQVSVYDLKQKGEEIEFNIGLTEEFRKVLQTVYKSAFDKNEV